MGRVQPSDDKLHCIIVPLSVRSIVPEATVLWTDPQFLPILPGLIAG